MLKKLYAFTGEHDGEECFALIEISPLTSEEAQRQNQILRQAWSSLCWTEPEQPGSDIGRGASSR